MKLNFNYEENLRFVPDTEDPTRDFYIMDEQGRRFETNDPVMLLDVVTGEFYADCDDYPTQGFLLQRALKNLALELSMTGVYAQLYDASGLIFDANFPGAEWQNPNEPVLLDGWDAETTLLGLIRAGKFKVFEKVPWLTATVGHVGCAGCAFNQVLEDGIPRCMENNNMPVANVTWEGACAFSATEGVRYPEYVEATADNMVDPSYKADWNPIAERKEEMDGARCSWTDSQQ